MSLLVRFLWSWDGADSQHYCVKGFLYHCITHKLANRIFIIDDNSLEKGAFFSEILFITFIRRVLTASPSKWLVAYGQVYTLLMDMNSLYVVRTTNERIVAEYSLPPFRRSVRGSNFIPGEIRWLDGLPAIPLENLIFATSMPDYSVLLLILKGGTWHKVEPIAISFSPVTAFLLCS